MNFKLLTCPKIVAYLHGQRTQNSPLEYIPVENFTPVLLDRVVFVVHKEWNYGSWGKGWRVSCPMTGGALSRPPASPTMEEEVQQLIMHFTHNKWQFRKVTLECRNKHKAFCPNVDDWLAYETRVNLQESLLD